MNLRTSFTRGCPGGRSAAAAVLVTAAVALLGGCGSSGHPSAAAGPSHPANMGGPAVSVPPAPGGSGGDAPAEAPGSAADAPKVPDAQLTPPGGGTFTKPEKRYLSGRVPEGTDPVAVLEGGQEVCERLTRTAKVDPDAAAAAIVTGDISRAGATAAVHSLCPGRQPVLDAADHGFPDGLITVSARPVPGTSAAPGSYHAPNPSPRCTWRVTDAKGRTLASGSAGTAARARLTVPATADSLTSSGCYAWLPSAPASGGTDR